MERPDEDKKSADDETRRQCDVCAFDRVVWKDVPQCAFQSFEGILNDVFLKPTDDWKGALFDEDRIYYVVATLLTVFALLSTVRRIVYV